MSGLLNDVYNQTARWYPRMPPPDSFSPQAVVEFQKLIDNATGTRDGRPINKLAWAPSELRWFPYRMGEPARGYTLPIFYYGNDEDGEKVAAPRWVLLERLEPEQYAPTWEQSRFSVYDGSVWDWRGPCPPERYVELRVHCYHDGACCPCRGAECKYMGELDHCWGYYLDPNNDLLDWVRRTIQASMADPEVRPTDDVRYFSAPQSQRDGVNRLQKLAEKQEDERSQAGAEVRDHLLRDPASVSFTRADSGLYLPN